MDNRDNLVAYLLGELPEEEQIRLEQEYLASDEAFEQILVLEDELAYDYVQGRLSPRRRQRFESTIGATDRGRKNLEFARLLLEGLRASRTAAVWPRYYWYGAVAAMLALAVLPAWLAIRVTGLTASLERVRAENAASLKQLNRELAAARNAPAAPVEMAFLLTPGLSRSQNGAARLQISASADTIRFELVPPPGSASGDYVVTIASPSGNQVWSGSAPLSGRTLVVKTPARLFTPGAYQVAIRRLTAGEQAPDLATYQFELIRD